MKKTKFKKSFSKRGAAWKDVRGENSRPAGVNRNSPDWYKLDENLAALSTAINLYIKNGTRVSLKSQYFAESPNVIDRMPGVAANVICLTPAGVSDSPNSAVNEASRSMMGRIRREINATRAYEMPDLFKYTYAVANIRSYISFLKLIYRTTLKFNPLNNYTPAAILTALSVDPSDMQNLGVQLKFYINTLVKRIENLKVPGLPLFNEVEDAFAHIYVDEDISKAQYIVNVPYYFWKFTINSSTSKSELVPVQFGGAPATPLHTFADLKNYGENLLVEIINDEDAAIISGDIMKAYSDLPEVQPVDDSIVEFEYSKEFLEKWHNSCQLRCFLFSEDTSFAFQDYKISENTSQYLDPYIEFDPTLVSGSAGLHKSALRQAGSRIIDFYDKDVTLDQKVVAMRWMYSTKETDAATFKQKFLALGTQFINWINIYYFNPSGVLTSQQYGGVLQCTHNGNYIHSWAANFYAYMLLTKWNYMPITIVEDNGDYWFMLSDFGNYAVIDERILTNYFTQSNLKSVGVEKLLTA